jgi:uncharacterized protein involved in exopolysaccharide biosynthesis
MEVLGALLRYRRLVIGVALTTAAAMATLTLLRPRTYTAEASFTPQATRSTMGALGGLAAQLGVVMPSNDGNQSPGFYADLLRSRTVLEPLVQVPVEFTWKGRVHRGTFTELAHIRGKDPLQRRETSVRVLRKSMAITITQRTGIVRVETTTRYPQLSAILTDSALGLLNSFNVETRRSQAAAQRQFLDQRLATVSQELQSAEDALRDFAQRNRGDLRNSPGLQVQQERLSRAVNLRAQVHSSLAQALEQAKLDEIRDTPLITVIEEPVPPVQPDRRGLVATTIVAFLVGLALGAVAALLRHAVVANRKDRPESFAELSAEFAAAKRDLLRIAWPLRRAPTGNGRS